MGNATKRVSVSGRAQGSPVPDSPMRCVSENNKAFLDSTLDCVLVDAFLVLHMLVIRDGREGTSRRPVYSLDVVLTSANNDLLDLNLWYPRVHKALDRLEAWCDKMGYERFWNTRKMSWHNEWTFLACPTVIHVDLYVTGPCCDCKRRRVEHNET